MGPGTSEGAPQEISAASAQGIRAQFRCLWHGFRNGFQLVPLPARPRHAGPLDRGSGGERGFR